MILNGKALAESVYEEIDCRGRRLGILIAGSDTVTLSFVRAKEKIAARLGVDVIRSVISEKSSTEEVVAALHELLGESDGVIVQLPLPSHVDTEKVLAALPSEKDVDGVSPKATVRPPVAGAVEAICESQGIIIEGKTAAVVGSGRLVGKPCVALLEEKGAMVTVVGKDDSLETLKTADIVILGAGQPGMVKPEHLKEGAVLIDAGTSESSGKVVGDADPSCEEKCSLFTPVPGGVGPVAVAMIFRNVHLLKNDRAPN